MGFNVWVRISVNDVRCRKAKLCEEEREITEIARVQMTKNTFLRKPACKSLTGMALMIECTLNPKP